MASMTSQDVWPSRGGEITRVAIATTIVCTLSTLWRLVVRFRLSPQMGLSDWLMFAGTALNFVCNVPFVVLAADHGMGRFKSDPFFTPPRVQTYLHYEFIAVCLQVYAMFLVKMSVCSYLMALDFSSKFRVIVAIVMMVVFTFNLVMPLLLHFGFCSPFTYHWHPEIVPQCWPDIIATVTRYAQILSNILTDLVYASAPIVCLRQADLTKQMRWGVRIMFLLALVGTGASIAKIVFMHRWLRATEPFYDMADLCVWGMNEIFICIVVANLPMQRRSFFSILATVLPERITTRLGIQLESLRYHDDAVSDLFYTSRRMESRIMSTHLADDASEMAVLALENGRIVMVPKMAATRERRRSSAALKTFWNNSSKDSFS